MQSASSSFNDDTDVLLGHSGLNLSGGEKQRLAFVKLILENKPILIMDEPTSGLDPVIEKAVIKIINAHAQERLVIIVTHNDAFKEISDHEINFV